MSKISKSFLIVSVLAFVSAFMPLEDSQAAIFSGSETKTGVVYGICLSEAARTDSSHKNFEECKDVLCDDPEFMANASDDDLIRCTPETAAGTGVAKSSLEGSGITHTDDFGDFVIKLVNFSLPYLTLAAFVGYVIAGFMYVTALGNDEQLQKAKKILVWSSIGLILVILSYAITNLLTGQLVEGLAG